MKLCIHIDGGSRGNPGPAAAGVIVADAHGRALLEAGYYLGRTTNNQAEYAALLRALRFAESAGATELLVHSDSELLVRQINGDYRVRSPDIVPLFNEARGLLGRFSRWKVVHVRRENNRRADEMANRAMDAGQDVVDAEFDPVAEPGGAAAAPTRAIGRIRAVCRRAPAVGACAAPCRKGDEFVFDRTTPAGLCVEAAAVVFGAVCKMRRSGAAGPESVSCPHPGCGASFDLTGS